MVGGSWSPYSGSIYSTTVSSGASQVFVNGQMMTEARWPNAGYNNPLHATYSTVGSASVKLLRLFDDHRHGSRGNASNGTWNGAKMAIIPGYQWRTGEPDHHQPDRQHPYFQWMDARSRLCPHGRQPLLPVR